MKMKKVVGGLAIAVFSMGLFFTTTNKSSAIENFSLTELVGLENANAEAYQSECDKGCHPKADSQCRFLRPWLGTTSLSASLTCFNGAPGGSVFSSNSPYQVN